MEIRTATLDAGDRARAELADLIDRQMAPLGLAAMALLAPQEGQVWLDVGCGAGQTILQLTDQVGPAGRVIGVDIAPGVLAVARRRTCHLSQVLLLREDAAGLVLPDRCLDGVFSRFGTTFFADPPAAFVNMRRMLKKEGRIGFVCWRSVRENELDSFCLEAVGLALAVDPSPYSFAEAGVISQVLRSAGYGRIRVKAHDAQVSSGDVDATMAVVTHVGALGRLLRENATLRPIVEPRLRAALTSRERNGVVNLGAATWIATASAG